MRTTVKRALACAIAVAVTTVAAPGASADPGDTVFLGGCFYFYAPTATDVSVIGDLSLTTHADRTPSGATVTCWLDVNGVEKAGTEFSYSSLITGVEVGANEIPKPGQINHTTLCEEVTYDDASASFFQCVPLLESAVLATICALPCLTPDPSDLAAIQAKAETVLSP